MNRTLLVLVFAVAAAACGGHSDHAAFAPRTVTQRAAADGQNQLPPGHPPVNAEPQDPSDSADADSLVISGTVAQTMNAGGYTYVLVRTKNGSLWTAVPEVQVQIGEAVTIDGQLLMENFKSKTLNRTFDQIIFGTLAGDDSPAPASPETATNITLASAMGAGPAAQFVTEPGERSPSRRR